MGAHTRPNRSQRIPALRVKEGIVEKELESFKPNLRVLAKPQWALWDELQATPPDFVLYGGTALAIRLGHRKSQDFDFFATDVFDPDELLRTVSYLRGAKVVRIAAKGVDVKSLPALASREHLSAIKGER